DLRVPVVADVPDRTGHDQLGPFVVVRYHDRTSETHRELGDRGWITAGPGGQRPASECHGVHAVRDHARQTHLGRDAVAPMDRVEVTGGAGVADQVRARDAVGLRCQRWRVGHRSPSGRTTSRAVAVTTTSSPLITSVRVVRKPAPPRSVISAMVQTQVNSSPAYSGRRYVNR